MELADTSVEYEKSYIVNKAHWQILLSFLNQAIINGELEVVKIRDVYFNNRVGFLRARSQDGRIELTRKTIDQKNPDKVIEETIRVTDALERRQYMVKLLKSGIFDSDDDKLKQLFKKASIPAIVDTVKSYFFESFYQALLSDRFRNLVPNRLDKNRIIIPLINAVLHLDLYEGRMLGLVKIDLELNENLTVEQEQEVFRNYESLLQGYDITRSEKRVYQNRRFIQKLLPYEMMFTNKAFFDMEQTKRLVIRHLGISKDDIPFITKIHNILKSPHLYQEVKRNQIQDIYTNNDLF